MYTFKKSFDSFHLNVENLKIDDHLYIFGNNGSGKSTLLRLMSGHLDKNQELDNSLYFHDPDIGLYCHGTGYINLRLFNIPLKDDWIRDCALFEKALKTNVNFMSLGMKKIIKIYLYLESDAKFLLLDEVFSNFDEETNEFLVKRIKNKKGCISIMTGHVRHKDFTSLEIRDGQIVD